LQPNLNKAGWDKLSTGQKKRIPSGDDKTGNDVLLPTRPKSTLTRIEAGADDLSMRLNYLPIKYDAYVKCLA